MIKKVLVVGYLGNMGRRYCSILNYLGIPWQGIEKHNSKYKIDSDVGGILIATPTDSHFENIVRYSVYNIPIICEKPITKSEDELETLGKLGINLTVINQYNFMGVTEDPDDTCANYYNTGSDGIIWDCINIIGLSKGVCKLQNNSPIWFVTINGKPLNRSHIDFSYVDCLKSWIDSPNGDFEYIYYSHKKVMDYEKSCCCNRNTSKEIVIPVAGKDRKAPCR